MRARRQGDKQVSFPADFSTLMSLHKLDRTRASGGGIFDLRWR